MPDYFITGASSGIGRALARELVCRGHRVWGIGRRAALSPEIAVEMEEQRFFYSGCDVACKDDVRDTLVAMQQHGFLPGTVILNAGINPEHLSASFSLSEFEEVVRVNLFGALVWVEALLPSFKARGWGSLSLSRH